MDDNTAAVWNTAIQAAGTLMGVVFGFVGGLITESLRRRREDKYRYAPEKRALYVRALAAAQRAKDYIDDFVNADPEGVALFEKQVDEFDVLYAELLAIAPASVFDAVGTFVQAVNGFLEGATAGDHEAMARSKEEQDTAFDLALAAIRQDLRTPL